MSTTGASEQGTVYVLDEPEAIEKKIKSAVTDSGSEIRRAPDKPGVSNLIEILAVAARSHARGRRSRARRARGYGDLKAAVAAATIEYLAPVRERYGALRADEPRSRRPRRRRRARARDRRGHARRRARADGRRAGRLAGIAAGVPAEQVR